MQNIHENKNDEQTLLFIRFWTKAYPTSNLLHPEKSTPHAAPAPYLHKRRFTQDGTEIRLLNTEMRLLLCKYTTGTTHPLPTFSA